MLDDYTLKVSFLGGFLVVVAFFASRYFSLGNDPGVRPSPYLLYLNNNTLASSTLSQLSDSLTRFSRISQLRDMSLTAFAYSKGDMRK
jgi:hypothetical protein